MQIEDWQKGDNSKTPSLERITLHDEWLKKVHQEILDKIAKLKDDEDEIILGFVD